MKPLKVSREMQDYVISLNGLSGTEISELTQEKYGKYVDKGTIRRIFERNGVERIYKKFEPVNKCYTEEMLIWLKEHYDTIVDREELTQEFNKKFGLNKQWKQLKVIIGREHFRSSVANRKEKEKHPYYKPIGSERTRHGTTYIKIADKTEKEYNGNRWGVWAENWVLKSHYMYEQYHNVKLGEDDVITFLNGDTNDYSKENLLKVSRYEFTQLNMMKANGKGELTLTALEIIRCKQIINKVAKE